MPQPMAMMDDDGDDAVDPLGALVFGGLEKAASATTDSSVGRAPLAEQEPVGHRYPP
jgi:hypothetical protein